MNLQLVRVPRLLLRAYSIGFLDGENGEDARPQDVTRQLMEELEE